MVAKKSPPNHTYLDQDYDYVSTFPPVSRSTHKLRILFYTTELMNIDSSYVCCVERASALPYEKMSYVCVLIYLRA
jgi:hypothetical protein